MANRRRPPRLGSQDSVTGIAATLRRPIPFPRSTEPYGRCKPSRIRDAEFGLHEHPPCPNCNTNPHSSVGQIFRLDKATWRSEDRDGDRGRWIQNTPFGGKGVVSRKQREPRCHPARGSFISTIFVVASAAAPQAVLTNSLPPLNQARPLLGVYISFLISPDLDQIAGHCRGA
jgi:hypothetical protein